MLKGLALNMELRHLHGHFRLEVRYTNKCDVSHDALFSLNRIMEAIIGGFELGVLAGDKAA
jgi:hypothetical protein